MQPKSLLRVVLAAALLMCLSAAHAAAIIEDSKPKTLPEVEKVDEYRPVGEEAGSEIVECRNVRITGSRQRKQACHTRGEWSAMRRNATDAVRTTQQKATMHFENEGQGAPRTLPGGGG